MLPELADLGQLFKITHWRRKGGTRGNEVCPHTAQGTVLNLYNTVPRHRGCRQNAFSRGSPSQPFQGRAAGSRAQSSPVGTVPVALADRPRQAGAVQAGTGTGLPGALGGCLTRGGQLGLAAGSLGGYKYTGRVNTWEEEKTSCFS